MTKIGFVTTNKVLAQSLSAAVSVRPDLKFESFQLLNPAQVLLDAQVLGIDAAVIDVFAWPLKEASGIADFCGRIHQLLPDCRILLLLSQDDDEGRAAAVNAVRGNDADDFVFYDTSLEYLFAKLSVFSN